MPGRAGLQSCLAAGSDSFMILTASAAHLSQMYTRGPATNLATSASLRRQNEHDNLRLNIPVSR
jgi:hypothetical protein